jgi:gamma-glutamylcyclotransferase (GGCT)/AIG2-like uncharacterized protein YtfP
VFVYGTLKRGESNHHWLVGASWQGSAELRGLVLHDLGPFPMAVIGDGRVHGEVYAVEESGLIRLDALEGYPRLYDRRLHQLSDGRRAWVYLGRARQVRHAPLVASGHWCGSRRRHSTAEPSSPETPAGQPAATSTRPAKARASATTD